MPEKAPKEKLDPNARPEALPTTPSKPKPQPAELVFDEADALFKKRSDV
jgi:hypothetical protein